MCFRLLNQKKYCSKCFTNNYISIRLFNGWGCSSNGRALALHARGTGFDPLHLHFLFFIHSSCYIHTHCKACISSSFSILFFGRTLLLLFSFFFWQIFFNLIFFGTQIKCHQSATRYILSLGSPSPISPYFFLFLYVFLFHFLYLKGGLSQLLTWNHLFSFFFS